MRIRAGYNIAFECPQPTPILLMLSIHPDRRKDLLSDDTISFAPDVPNHAYLDGFGNVCTRILAPEGRTDISCLFDIADSGELDEYAPGAIQHEIRDLPDEVLVYLLSSRYCETERLKDFAWSTFGGTALGWARVQAIVAFVHNHIRFDYQRADSMRTAWGGFVDQTGVCRDFAHLAVTLCRCMNIPARYCTGYLGDIGVPVSPDPMDFSAWFQVWLGNRWYTFDARHNRQRIGRILMATGRDATDVAISTSFGPSQLARFDIITDEIVEQASLPA